MRRILIAITVFEMVAGILAITVFALQEEQLNRRVVAHSAVETRGTAVVLLAFQYYSAEGRGALCGVTSRT